MSLQLEKELKCLAVTGGLGFDLHRLFIVFRARADVTSRWLLSRTRCTKPGLLARQARDDAFVVARAWRVNGIILCLVAVHTGGRLIFILLVARRQRLFVNMLL